MSQFIRLTLTLLVFEIVHGQLYDDDYSYDDEGLGEEYEVLHPQVIPEFTSHPQHFKVPSGHSVRMPCKVQNLGHMTTSWKKVDPRAAHNAASATYLTTGKHKLTGDPNVRLEDVSQEGSTLVIDRVNRASLGDYVCEVSSNPPATLRHQLSILSPPTATILMEEDSHDRKYKIDAGQELALVCHGTGDPEPVLKWRRERKRLPDGRNELIGSQVIYQNVTRKHSGTYICEASNGPGQSAIDSVIIDVLHAPEILGEQTFVEKDDGIQMELVCIVHGSPVPEIVWFRDGARVIPDNRIRAGRIGRKHLLTVDRITAEADAGTYVCKASNDKGQSMQSFRVLDIPSRPSSGRQGRLADIPSLQPPPPPPQAIPSEASSSPSDNTDIFSWALSTSIVFANVLFN